MRNDGRKIPPEFENPIDNILISIAIQLNPVFHKLQLTPNHLTTISILFGIASAYHLCKKNNKLSVILLPISFPNLSFSPVPTHFLVG